MDRRKMKAELQGVFDTLVGISVPIGLLQQIGIPIMNAMERLNGCIESIGDPAQETENPNEEKAIREEDL